MKIATHLLVAALLIPCCPVVAQEQSSPGWTLDQKGCKHWNPNPVPNEKLTWTGGCTDGLAAGYGEQRWIAPNRGGSVYVGTMQDGRLTGSGVLVYETGSRYEGQYMNGLRHGRGVYIGVDGTRYEGEFARGYFHGSGSIRFPSGNSYKGQFEDGEMRGTVQVSWADPVSPTWLETKLNPLREQALKPGQTRIRPKIRITDKCTPAYPEFARRMDATGTTRVALLITPQGKAIKTQVTISAGDTPAHKLLDFATVAALWECVFDPGTIDGQVVEMWMTAEFVWTLK